MEEWIYSTFGSTLTDLFFGPFHELYTAGFGSGLRPQDPYKSSWSLLFLLYRVLFDRTPPVGYNTKFVYPVEGLNTPGATRWLNDVASFTANGSCR